ncbi:MAG: sugar transferase [Syntrophaceae bacterium]|nr:sugar transferase [Syntrophaceae bacterium]
MLNQRNRIRSIALLITDLLATILAFLCAYAFREAFQEIYQVVLFPLSWYLNLLWLILPFWVFVFYLLGLYQYWRGPGFWKEAWMVLKAIFIASFLLGFGVFALKFQFVSRIFILSFSIFDLFLVLLFRWVCRKIIQYAGHYREDFRYILMVGMDEEALKLAQGIEKHRDLGIKVLGFLFTGEKSSLANFDGFRVLGSFRDLPQILQKEVVDEVIFSISREELKKMENLLLLCEERGITTRVVLNFFPHIISKTHLEELEGFPLLTFSTTPKNEMALLFRRISDFLGGLVLIILLAPFLFIIALLIRIDSPGPSLYRQPRYGLNGRKFTCYKFRSMHLGSDEKRKELIDFNLTNGPAFKMKNDPRVTRVGKYLRKASLDELPQLLNVLKGDMSFVGPRPLLLEEVEKLEGWQRRRLSMKPGITGLWQVSGRNQIDFNEWMKLDLEYIDNWSLWLDLKILLKTIPVVLSGKGAM